MSLLMHVDVPTQIPSGCEISSIMQRGDPRDVLVIKAGRPACKISDLPPGSVIGTSSIRRTAQIALRYPHLVVKDCRGNVGTRLAKLDAEDGPFDGIILAAAGLHRLKLTDRITQYLGSDDGGMLYAVGQGALCIESREDDSTVKDLVFSINHRPTQLETLAERSLLRTLEGGCSAPLGVESTWVNKTTLELRSIVVSTDGRQAVEAKMVENVETVDAAEHFGIAVASELLSKGADKILAEIKAKRPTTITDLEEK
jgi:hydroxymethylbilane synthase